MTSGRCFRSGRKQTYRHRQTNTSRSAFPLYAFSNCPSCSVHWKPYLSILLPLFPGRSRYCAKPMREALPFSLLRHAHPSFHCVRTAYLHSARKRQTRCAPCGIRKNHFSHCFAGHSRFRQSHSVHGRHHEPVHFAPQPQFSLRSPSCRSHFFCRFCPHSHIFLPA